MSSSVESPKWSVFEDVKNISAAPEALMADINAAISALEYARAAAAATFLHSSPSKAKTLIKS